MTKLKPIKEIMERNTAGTLSAICCPFCHCRMIDDTEAIGKQVNGKVGWIVADNGMIEGRFMLCPLCRFMAFFNIQEYGI